MREEWKAGNEGRASTDAGVVQEVPTSTFRCGSAPRRRSCCCPPGRDRMMCTCVWKIGGVRKKTENKAPSQKGKKFHSLSLWGGWVGRNHDRMFIFFLFFFILFFLSFFLYFPILVSPSPLFTLFDLNAFFFLVNFRRRFKVKNHTLSLFCAPSDPPTQTALICVKLSIGME